MKKREELKKLESMKSSLKAEISSLELEEKGLKEELSIKKARLNTLNQRIKNLGAKKGLTVSEHAILRYLERVEGLDLKEIEEKILPESEKPKIRTLGNGHYPINKGEFKIIVKDGVVVTLYKED